MIKKECCVCLEQEVKENLHKHHIDGNHDNNDPDNVVVLCKRCHVAIHRHGSLASKAKLLEVRKKILSHKNNIRSYKNDPFASKWGSDIMVFCRLCGEVYPENKAKWDAESEELWCKNHPDCNGRRKGFDLILVDKMREEGFQT